MRHRSRLLIALWTALVLAGCGESEEKKAAREAADKLEKLAEQDEPKDLQEAMNRVGDVLEAFGDSVETVSAQDLKGMLPEDEFAGMKRKSHSAKKTGAFGINVSKAEAVYVAEADRGRLTLSITDIGTMKGVVAMGLNWIDMEIDEENEAGFERTTDFQGYKSHQKMQKAGGRSNAEFTVFVANRFVVQASGEDIEWEVVEKAITQVPFAELDDMKDQGVALRE